ncbi:MAG: glycoside hydrolase [Gorillibacterium sp.]|nr:glycoside hydrolase [Gorillibacterium sp.]
MSYPRKSWKIHVMHHSHTDIGYTDRQEKIERYHVNFIKQAIEISEAAHQGKQPEWAGFRWICETFWAVEQFLKYTDESWHERFKQTLLRGTIELTGNYLNFTELLDEELLAASLRKANQFAKQSGLVLNSAMTADINGYAWGYAQSLLDAGIENLFSCVHTHHGMFPLGRKQIPFWWETAKGEKLLVWNGEHYNLGNELGLASNVVDSYARDELTSASIVPNPMELAEKSIIQYLNNLEAEQYPYDFAPVMVSGLFVDNAPPNTAILDFIREWNKKHGAHIQMEMSTLQGFFDTLRESTVELPVYRGDWPDWWSDGPASTALSTQLYRDAVRTLRTVRSLDPLQQAADKQLLEAAEYNLMMYAEHTWGYSSSVGEPWHPLVQALGARKERYATEGHRLVYSALDEVLAQEGEVSLAAETDLSYKIINPLKLRKIGVVALHVHYWQLPLIQEGFQVVNETTAETLPYQMQNVARGTLICVPYSLEADEQARYKIVPMVISKPVLPTTSSFLLIGADGVVDATMKEAEQKYPVIVNESGITSPFVDIRFAIGEGIHAWLDRKSGQELLRSDREHGAFTPIYEVTPVNDLKLMLTTRGKMGRNRKGKDVHRSVGQLTSVNCVEEGALFSTVELLYKVEGMEFYSLFLTVYATEPRVDVKVRMLKQSVWKPENVYISLPFCNGAQEGQLWVEKTGTVMRPGLDQLPGTGTDFYCLQEGTALWGNGTGICMGMPDTPLLQTGSLEYGVRKLMGHPALSQDKKLLYAWVLNNFWETNFKACVGGFYEFRYHLQWGSYASPEAAIQACHQMNTEAVVFKVSAQ